MIAEAEIRRLAARWQVDPMLPDLDYSLGWFLLALSATTGAPERLCFKGGTCLRKCYFPGYRYSEDLDFTARAHISLTDLSGWIEKIAHWSAEQDGPNFSAAAPRLEVVADEYGKESYQVRVYYRGPLQWGGSPRSIRLDVTRDESLLLPAEARRISHPYSDAASFASRQVACYSLREVLAEKVRAVCGQRRFAISRDVYDIYRLVQSGIAPAEIAPLLPAKFAARGVDLEALDTRRLQSRKGEYELDWQKRLNYLVPEAEAVAFESAWPAAIDFIKQLQTLLPAS